MMTGALDAYDRVDAMPDYLPEVKYPRTPGYRPKARESIQRLVREDLGEGAPHGRLAASAWC